MAQLVTMGANLMCSFGAVLSSIMVAPENVVIGTKTPLTTVMDNVRMNNILPFTICRTPYNPAVASTTATAMGVSTPAPNIPVTSAPWSPGSPTVMIKNWPALNSSSKCKCNRGGVRSVTFPGQVTVNVL